MCALRPTHTVPEACVQVQHGDKPDVHLQALNVGIYRAIGNSGVYYGFKLGHHVPWHTGFPFNVVSHPQYVGSALTVWGAIALVRLPRQLSMVNICFAHAAMPKLYICFGHHASQLLDHISANAWLAAKTDYRLCG